MGGDSLHQPTVEEWRVILGDRPLPSNWPKELRGVEGDSRRMRPGYVFVAQAGYTADGHRFVEEAVRKGAVAIVHEQDLHCSVPSVKVSNARETLTRLSRCLQNYPDRELRLTGVTGTNGKTSVAGFVQQLNQACGVNTGLLGTVNYAFGGRRIPARRTTPGAPELHELLRSIRYEQCTDAVMEVSSHALDQGRVLDLEFDTAVFTNLSQDHLDYHQTMEAYFAAKAKLFACESLKHRIVGEGDWSEKLAGLQSSDVIRCGLGDRCDVRAELMSRNVSGTAARIESPWGNGTVLLGLPGEHNLRNLLQALAVVGVSGLPFDTALEAVEGLLAAPGRLERVPSKFGQVFVDYAHTPDALDNVLGALRPLTRRRLIVVFGCGGDRDRTKRRPMVDAALRWADRVILTQDNPRTEDPEQILSDMTDGLGSKALLEIIKNREEAIWVGVEHLWEGDVLLIAGKGHETVQEIGSQQIPFDDREKVLRALRARELYETGVE